MAIPKQLTKSIHGVSLFIYLFLWLRGGDYNEILKDEEKRGGQQKNTASYV